MPLLDILICIVMVALGAVLMHWAHEVKDKAVRKERDRAESWKAAYTSLRYDTKPYESPEALAPAPLQLNVEDVWAVRCGGQTTRSKRA